MLTVYTAAASAERDRARAAMALVASTPGMCVALDWVSEMDRAKRHELDLPWEHQADIAARCLAAARQCDVLWFLVPEEPSRGAWVELGAAMATGFVRIILSGRHTTAFLAHERIDRRYASDLLAFEAIKDLR
jgi:hypothetical protein